LIEAIDSGTMILYFEATPGSDLTLKNPIPMETHVKSALTDNADFENMEGVIELKVSFTIGDQEYRFGGNLSLVTLKGMGNLIMVK